MKKNFFGEIFLQFLKFGVIGFFNTLISIVVTYACLFCFKKFSFIPRSLNAQILVSSFLGFSISFINSYYWNKKFVFRKPKVGLQALFKSYCCYVLTWAVSYLLTYIVTNYLFIPKIYIPVLSLFLTVPLNFLANKFWAFS